MARQSKNLEKVTVRLFDGDFEKIQSKYPNIGANEAIRRLVRSHIVKLQEKDDRNTIPSADEILNDSNNNQG